jgi:hypothetical protein
MREIDNKENELRKPQRKGSPGGKTPNRITSRHTPYKTTPFKTPKRSPTKKERDQQK